MSPQGPSDCRAPELGSEGLRVSAAQFRGAAVHPSGQQRPLSCTCVQEASPPGLSWPLFLLKEIHRGNVSYMTYIHSYCSLCQDRPGSCFLPSHANAVNSADLAGLSAGLMQSLLHYTLPRTGLLRVNPSLHNPLGQRATHPLAEQGQFPLKRSIPLLVSWSAEAGCKVL